jgi:hypothetical protein
LLKRRRKKQKLKTRKDLEGSGLVKKIVAVATAAVTTLHG